MRLKFDWRKRDLVFWLYFVFLIFPTASFIVVSIGFLTYIYFPVDLDSVQIEPVGSQAEHVIVISHGLRDTPGTWADELKSTLSDGAGAWVP